MNFNRLELSCDDKEPLECRDMNRLW